MREHADRLGRDMNCRGGAEGMGGGPEGGTAPIPGDTFRECAEPEVNGGHFPANRSGESTNVSADRRQPQIARPSQLVLTWLFGCLTSATTAA